eukprot:CAMPEP_0113602448 /NCGR_PEP_ID=MMETSP0017_2-20120614/761_1 /TAXON_ID=2856 /ORGANISM="Cylindrotheca closterium" /LENGTH=463 /DNA_ID=CAMNT_0000510795 /DNA_START=1 /DNA_END=1392 /DNA_ORIENTATION=+ /assembly_acc=CAM_ASM_000147
MITLALAVFAFRREIVYAILHFLNKLFINSRTGKLTLSPTQILKLLLFVDLMRKLQNGGGKNKSDPNANPAIQTLGKMNPLVGSLIKGILTSNPAYIPPMYQHYTFERVNERYLKDGLALHKAIHSTHDGFKWPSSHPVLTHNVEGPTIKMGGEKSNETAIILDLTKLGPSPSETIRDQVSFVLSQYRQAAMKTKDNNSTNIEIIAVLESPGGSAVDFGLAAQQLLRLRDEPGVLLTICVDRVAASGGYMLACTASPGRLFAAPFSVVGSIGVIGQVININELLERSGVTPIVFRGGKNKAPLGMIGKVTKHSMDKTQSMVDDTHRAFKQHVVDSRPILKDKIAKVGTGDVWLGSDAIGLDLIDGITTSDEYISEKVSNGVRVLKMLKCPPRSLLFGRHPILVETSMKANPISGLVQAFLGFVKNSAGVNDDPRISLRDGIDAPMGEKLPIAASTVDTPKLKL